METFEMLTLASEFPEPFTWTFEGPCRVEHVEHVWKREIAASWTDSGLGMLDDVDRAIWQIAMGGRYGDRAPTITVEATDGSWNTPHVHPYTRDENAGTTELHWWSMWHRLSDAPVVATALFLTDAPSVIFPDDLPDVPRCPGRTTGENGLRTRLFGREALIRPKTVEGAKYLAVSYGGEPLDESRVNSILTVLSLVLGRDLDVRAQVAVDADGGAVERRLWVPSKVCPQAPRSAVSCVERPSIVALGAALEAMTERARSLRFDQDSAIDVAIKYLLRWNGGQLDLEIRDITSALNVLIESPAFSPNEGRVVEPDDFKSVVKALNIAIDALPAAPETLRKRLRDRIAEANQTSTNERHRRFWDAVGFEPTAEELLALKRRHTMAHKGFIDTEDAEAEWALFQDIGRARTVVNESILALLGYDGPVIDYLKGTRPMRERGTPSPAETTNANG